METMNAWVLFENDDGERYPIDIALLRSDILVSEMLVNPEILLCEIIPKKGYEKESDSFHHLIKQDKED